MSTRSVWMRRKSVVAAAALVLGLVGGVGIATAGRVSSTNQPAEVKLAPANEGPSAGFAPVVKKVLPAVVSISTSKVVKTPTGFGQLPNDPFFQQFFGNQFNGNFNAPREQREQALGSGVIVSPNGYILTNNHVVDGASDIRVTLADKREFTGRVIGTDPKTDIAVLKIDANDLPALTLGDSSKVQIGDYALAVGDPFGVGQTVTMGIVSATGRTGLGIEDYEDFIQTDAPINPGNSGGALVNDRGELIGINTAIIAHGSEGNQGIGFAVPVNLAHVVMDDILKTGKVTRAYMGIVPQDVTPSIAKAFGEKEPSGALVSEVSPNSPAAKAGLERGDIILDLDGKPVNSANQLRMTVSMMHPNAAVDLKVWRNSAVRDMSMNLGELPVKEASAQNEENGTKSSLSGVSVQNLDADTAQQLGLPANSHGVVVTGISPSSNAADSGLQRGDVIQEVNRQPVNNTQEFERALHHPGEQNLLLVNRQGTTMYLTA